MSGNLDNQTSEMELPELIDSLICESISESQFRELSRHLTEDPAARELYLAELEIESQLRNRNADSDFESVIFPVEVSGSGLFANRIVQTLCAIAAMVVVAALIAFQMSQKHNDGLAVNSTQPELVAPDSEILGPALGGSVADFSRLQSVARVTNGKEMVWKASQHFAIGSWLKPGVYELISGNLEITFDAGTVLFVAPNTTFQIVNANEVRLLLGSLEADVPEQAIGFKVQTPSGEITDLSTKFGVTVTKNGDSDVHVLKGLVEAKPINSSYDRLVTLKENSAIRMFLNAPPEPVAFSPERFFEFGSRNNQHELNYLHFSFDDDDIAQGVVKNDGSGGAGRGGKIVSGIADNSWVQVAGPFGRSLFFSGEGAKIKTHIKGIDGNQPRTVSFWVRISEETPMAAAYSFVSWGHPRDGLGNKWQIGWNPNYESSYDGTDEGVLGAIRTEFGRGFVIGSTDLRDGRWHHITSVFLGGNRGDNVSTLVRHYVDGKLESISGFKDMKIDTDSNLQTLTIGEYLGLGQEIFSGYKGWIDEFYLFDEALTPAQIVQLMETNEPPAAGEIVSLKTQH